MSFADDYYRQWSEDVAGEFSRRYNDADSHRTVDEAGGNVIGFADEAEEES